MILYRWRIKSSCVDFGQKKERIHLSKIIREDEIRTEFATRIRDDLIKDVERLGEKIYSVWLIKDKIVPQ